MPPRRLDPREIYDLSDAMEDRVLENIRVEFRSKIALMKSVMISEIVSAWGGLPRHVGIEGSYEEVAKDLEVVGSSGEDKIDRVELIDLLDWWIYCFGFAKNLEDASKNIGP